MPMAEPYKPPFPHPAKVVPKVVVIVCAILVFTHLFWNLRPKPSSVPHPIRVSLVHAEKGVTGEEALRSGLVLISPLDAARTPRALRFDFPLGSEHAGLTYNARAFLEQNHLGADLNGIGGQNSDLGDPVYSAGDGLVIFAGNPSPGWGNVVVVQHRGPDLALFQTLYAHLKSMYVSIGEPVTRGQQLGTVGNASGRYLAHLHLECRDSRSLDVGGGYAPFALDRRAPESYLPELRNAEAWMLNESFASLRERLGKAPVELKGKTDSSEQFRLEPTR